MVEAQTAAITACNPGAKCCDVYNTAMEVLREGGYRRPSPSRIGHGLGLSYCELPVILPDEKSVLMPGMVLNIEPGLYFPGKYCFRHCDTIVVTEGGHEVIESYPRDLESLTILKK
jgi:Xaa-Pro aminopeptidase